jgi:membrane-bound inhibitor of C-type lysozyme
MRISHGIKLWTPEEDERLRSMISAGLRPLKIAVKLHRTVEAVYGRASDLRLSFKRARSRSGLRYEQMISRRWSKDEEAKLAEMRDAGRPFPQIAKALECTQVACEDRWYSVKKARDLAALSDTGSKGA